MLFTRACLACFLASTMLCGAAMAKDAPASADDPNELICTYESRTGSHLKKKVCETRSVREQRAREDQEAMRKFKHGGARPAGGDGGPRL